MKLPIYRPRLLTDGHRDRLTNLLSRLLSERLGDQNSNLAPGDIALSGSERLELQFLVEESISDKSLFSTLTFVDGLLGSAELSHDDLRELYLSERRRRGYSRAVASSQWYQFLTRLGMPGRDQSTLVKAATPMPFEHFLRMEAKLFTSSNIPLSAQEHMINAISDHRNKIEDLRENFGRRVEAKSPGFSIMRQTKSLLEALRDKAERLSTNQVSGLGSGLVLVS